MTTAEQFTPEQQRIVNLPVEARAIVNAAAGTGKTHVLAGRLNCLIERDGLSAGDELLVLSFSRAAVGELRRRVSGLTGDARYVAAATFDSLATRLLASAEPGDRLTALDYRGRLVAATALLASKPVPGLLTLVRHTLIDEVQDLVGERAAFVLALLDRIDKGFTLFGDPAQAIYGYQLRGPNQSPTNEEFCASVAQRFEASLVVLALARDFRGGTANSVAIAQVGSELRGREPDHDRIASELRSLMLRLPVVTLATSHRIMTRNDGRATAFLCRTNAEALRLSDQVSRLGVAHRYQRRADDRAVPSWLSEALRDVTSTRVTKSDLLAHLERLVSRAGLTGGEMFRLVKLLDHTPGESVDLRRVAERLRVGGLPEELNDVEPSSVVISTVHRAKGLQFETVVLCDHDSRAETGRAEENRLLYVALSRAKSELFVLEGLSDVGLFIDRASGRYVRRGFGPNRRRLLELEFVGSDSDAIHPAGTWLFQSDPSELQAYIAGNVSPGDPVRLQLTSHAADRSESDEVDVPRYVIYHSGKPVGSTSDAFGSLLLRALGRSRPPRTIADLHVEMVDSVAGDGTMASRHGLGPHGIWARIRVRGLGTLESAAVDSVGED